MSDNITLPREVVERVETLMKIANKWSDDVDILASTVVDLRDDLTELRAALASPRPEPSGYAYRYADGVLRLNDGSQFNGGWPVEAVPYWFAPPAAAPEPTHPGYVIGNHWLETAYSRVCAGEAEADVLRDCGWERVDEALRRDAERYRWLLNWLLRTELLTAQRCRIDAPETYGDWYILRKPYAIDGSVLVGYGKTEDAAIDAAMKEVKP